MANQVPTRIANILINALKGGVVPRVGLEYITVGRTQEIAAILHDIEMIEQGSASFRFIVGKYGSGKSFLLQTIRNYATAKGFVVVDADLSPERRFAGTKGQGLATYKELIQNLSTKSKPDGGALTLILEKWISGIQTSVKAASAKISDSEFDQLVEQQIYAVAGSLEGMVNGFEFAKAVVLYYQAYRQDDSAMKSNVLKWFRGEYSSKKEAKTDLNINFIVTDETWYDFLKLFAAFLVGAGYKGMIVIIDELVNIFKIPNSITRANNYEKILTMYNDVLQGKAQHIGFLMGGTPQCIEDKYKGVFSYEALRSRLAEGHFATADVKDLSAPMIRLQMLSQEHYKRLLSYMLEMEQIQKIERNGLIIGREGEKLINSYKFLTVFLAPEYLLVKDESRTIGTVDKVYPVGIRFALAGMTWETVEVNEKSKVIFVKKVPGISLVDWDVDFSIEIHTVLVQKMRNILLSPDSYPYLSDRCKERLAEIQYITRNSGVLTTLVTPLSNKKYAVFPWVGTRQLMTLNYALRQRKIKSSLPWITCIYLEVIYSGTKEELEGIIRDILHSNLNLYDLPLGDKVEVTGKYNEFVPRELLRKQFIEDYLDFEGLKRDALI